MKRYLTIGYGSLSYLLFLVAFCYAIVFVGAILPTRTVDHGISAPLWQALLIGLGLLGIFGVQHSVMARPAFKRWWTCFVPSSMERSAYVLLASCALRLLYWQWLDGVGSAVGRPADRLPMGAVGAVLVRLGDSVGVHLHDQPFRPVRAAAGVSRGKPYSD